MQRMVGWIMLFVGLTLLFGGFIGDIVSNVTITVEAPAVILATCPENGLTYDKLNSLVLCVEEAYQVSSVKCKIGTVTYTLIKGTSLSVFGGEGTEIWRYPPSGSLGETLELNNAGTHSFTFSAVNSAGTSTVEGSYTITEDLTGNWYVNNVQVTSPTQTISVASPEITFKFQKTDGPADSQITCTVTWTGASSGTETLSNTGAGVWQETVNFGSYGTYDVTLKATDGDNAVTMQIFSFEANRLSWVPVLSGFSLTALCGAASTAIGLILVLTSKPKT